eukprot:6522024-Pyramimonas_sp.AAC.1
MSGKYAASSRSLSCTVVKGRALRLISTKSSRTAPADPRHCPWRERLSWAAAAASRTASHRRRHAADDQMPPCAYLSRHRPGPGCA